MPSEMRRLKQFEEENGKLRKLVADLSLDRAMLQDVLARKLLSLRGDASWWMTSGLRGRSRSVGPALPSGWSHRHTHYRGKRRSQAALIGRIKEIATTRVRYGYRRIHMLLRREGWAVKATRI